MLLLIFCYTLLRNVYHEGVSQRMSFKPRPTLLVAAAISCVCMMLQLFGVEKLFCFRLSSSASIL